MYRNEDTSFTEEVPEMADSQSFDQKLHEVFTQLGQQEKAQKIERYRRLNVFAKKGQILFCGSSLMEQFPINELLMDLGCPLTVYNRGIGGFTTAEMAEALEACVFELEPRAVFINIGTNDMNGPEYEQDALMARYEDILRRIRARLPEAEVYLLAYYPVNPEVGRTDPFVWQALMHRTNERILEANRAAELLADRLGMHYIDLNAGITDEKGQMKAEYTIEGMHMYGDGYMQVLEALLPVLKSV